MSTRRMASRAGTAADARTTTRDLARAVMGVHGLGAADRAMARMTRSRRRERDAEAEEPGQAGSCPHSLV